MPTPIDRQARGDEPIGVGQPLEVRYDVGTVLCGKYRLEALLGEGGMGAVWRASNISLDLPVAIKLIRADLDRGSLRARLQLEARAAAQLGHPAIVRVYDVGESELGDPFIVMEHLRGETLAQLLSQGRLPATRAVQLLLPIIDALGAAHARGIVHRDLKPDNVMIALEEQHIRPKILDFGVAKVTCADDSQNKLTKAGALIGSPEYMSPEQACGRDDLDGRSDIWSVCVVLYEAVTGRPPFTGTSCVALLQSIVEDEPKPLSQHAVADVELWAIVERGLRKARAQRYAKISELGQALAGWLVRQGISEDACGSSLESNWLGHSSDPQRLNQTLPSLTLERRSQEGPAQAANLGTTAIAHRSFSATIPPGPSWRTRGFGVIAACMGLGVVLLALGHSPAAAVPAARGPAQALTLPAPPVLALAPGPGPQVALEPPVPAVLAPGVAGPVDTPREPESKPSAAPRPSKPSALRVSSLVTTAAGPPPNPQSNRPLDLLNPY